MLIKLDDYSKKLSEINHRGYEDALMDVLKFMKKEDILKYFKEEYHFPQNKAWMTIGKWLSEIKIEQQH